MDVSHPSSDNYGKFLSAEEVHDLFKPAADVVQQVKDWLLAEGVDESSMVHSDNKGWLAVDLPAHQVERFFNTEYYLHEHPEKGLTSVGCEEYSVPEHLSQHIDYIRPGVKLSTPVKRETKVKRDESVKQQWPHGPQWARPDHWPMPKGAQGLAPDLQNCGVNITPPCLRALYGIPKGKYATPGLELGLFEQGSYYDASDVNEFFKNFAPWVPQGTLPETKSIDGGEAPIDCTDPNTCGEADIDIDLATSLIYPQKVINFQVDDSYYAPREVALDNTFNTFLDALDGSYCTYKAFGIKGDSPGIDPKYPDPHKGGYKGKLQCGVYKPTKVISASYGESEEDFPKKYAQRQCNEFMKLGLQGHSIFVSAGDYGVAQPPGDPPGSNGCLSNEAEGLNGTIFNPAYPGDCPYVTSVGATMLPRNGTVNDKELTMYVPEVAPHFSSAGGFSNFYPMPSYQAKAVQNYLDNHVPK
jgi:tripeptidyl-peptidase-1